MRSPSVFLTTVSFVLLTGGCVGFFERELELVALPYERQLVLNTILSPQDSQIRADVYVTAPPVGDLPTSFPRNGMIEDAYVRLVGPTDTFMFEFQRLTVGSPTYLLPQTEVELEVGQLYEVIAEWDGLIARGQTIIPERMTPRDSITLQEIRDVDGDRNVLATWPNQMGEADYYLLFTDEVTHFGGSRSDRVQRVLYDFIHGRNALGTELSGELGISPNPDTNVLNICQCTQTIYDYLLTRETLQINDENPFAEPTTVANNLQEGLGLVGAANCWQFAY